jgi:hypothetical protein
VLTLIESIRLAQMRNTHCIAMWMVVRGYRSPTPDQVQSLEQKTARQ